MEKLLVEMNLYFRRNGDLDGLFVCTREQLEALIGTRVYFGEVLGKHSEVIATLEEGDFTVKSEDQEFIKKFEEVLGISRCGTISGHNPISYIEENWDCGMYDDASDEFKKLFGLEE